MGYADENQNAANERLKSAASNAPPTFSEVCDRTLFETGSYSMMLRAGIYLSKSYVFLFKVVIIYFVN